MFQDCIAIYDEPYYTVTSFETVIIKDEYMIHAKGILPVSGTRPDFYIDGRKQTYVTTIIGGLRYKSVGVLDSSSSDIRFFTEPEGNPYQVPSSITFGAFGLFGFSTHSGYFGGF